MALSSKAKEALAMVRDEYGDSVAKEIMREKIRVEPVNCDVVNEHHIKLLKRSFWMAEHTEFGAPAMDGKRPYGNGGVLDDIREITGLLNSDTTLENLHWGLIGVLQLWTNRGCPALETLLGEKIEYSRWKVQR